MKNILIFLLCFSCDQAIAQVNFQESDSFPQKKAQADLHIFLDTLYVACQRKDTAQLFKMIDKDVFNAPSYGNDGMKHNLQAFKDYWGMRSPEKSFVWKILIDNLESGGIFSYPNYRMPNIRIETNGKPLAVAKFQNCRVNIVDSLPVYNNSKGDSLVGHLKKSTIICDENFGKYGYGLVEGFILVSLESPKISGWTESRYLYKYDWSITVEIIDGKWMISSFSKFE